MIVVLACFLSPDIFSSTFLDHKEWRNLNLGGFWVFLRPQNWQVPDLFKVTRSWLETPVTFVTIASALSTSSHQLVSLFLSLLHSGLAVYAKHLYLSYHISFLLLP